MITYQQTSHHLLNLSEFAASAEFCGPILSALITAAKEARKHLMHSNFDPKK